MWTEAERTAWEKDGYFVVRGFAEPGRLAEMQRAVDAIAIECDGAGRIGDALIQPESALQGRDLPPEQRVSKIFRIHRQVPVFEAFCRESRLLDRVEAILGPDLDCFLSQFIYKRPGALGQPWHQDAYYFPFDRGPQVGVWLAVTEARIDNGPLWVLPGSHREPVHPVVADARPHANLGYVEIVDHDMEGAQPVLLQPGDVAVFHSHLMHRSTDNGSDDLRAAMVYHYGEAGTVDHSLEKFGYVPPNQEWMPVRRSAA